VQRITEHLNLMNSRSKAVQMECQKMFLRLFFRTRVEVHDAIVYSLRDNGFLAYVPVFDYKGPVYFQNRMGVVFMDPALLTPGASLIEEGAHSDPTVFDKRGKELPGYECVLSGERSDSNEAQELLVGPKKQGREQGVGPVLRILPLQRVRVAMTSAPSSGSSGASAMRLILVSTAASGKAADANKSSKNDATHRFTDEVIQAEEKNKLSAVSSRLEGQATPKSRKEQREESLYSALKAALQGQRNGFSAPRASNSHRQTVCANRYEIMPGRVAFGPQEGVRSIFILSRNKAIEIEKAKERRLEDKADRSGGNELLIHTMQKKKNTTSYSGTSKEVEEELLLESLKDGKTAAMMKMQQWGEEWAEEEELPTNWEAGEGGGADTELGKKAATGGFSKELYLATARQSKLKVAKKNSKYG
jgi:hypothetical protein